jgi:hypothetical protein
MYVLVCHLILDCRGDPVGFRGKANHLSYNSETVASLHCMPSHPARTGAKPDYTVQSVVIIRHLKVVLYDNALTLLPW